MKDEREAPKGSPPPEKNKRRLPVVLYWSAYAALIVAVIAGNVFLGAIGFPRWLAIVLAVVVIGFAVWYLEDSPVNPRREIDKDPFNRNFFAVNLHMVRTWRLRGRDMDWRETRAADLPPHAASAFNDLLGVDPELSAEVDGLLWVVGERDWHGYPDPPRFVIVGFDAAGKVKAADDLHGWPKAWAAPAGTVGQPKQS
jgi:hypothetical protein